LKIYVVGDKITVYSFAIAGTDGKVVNENSSSFEILQEFENCINDPEIGIVVFNKFIHKIIGDKMEEYLNKTRPIFFEVPDTDAEFEEEDLQRIVQKVIGIKIE